MLCLTLPILYANESKGLVSNVDKRSLKEYGATCRVQQKECEEGTLCCADDDVSVFRCRTCCSDKDCYGTNQLCRYGNVSVAFS